jgi:hypothetical protein
VEADRLQWGSCGSHYPRREVVCWGQDGQRQCDVPPELEGQTVVAVSCYGALSAALTLEGKVVCWGAIPEDPLNMQTCIDNAVAICCGCGFIVVLRETGAVPAGDI